MRKVLISIIAIFICIAGKGQLVVTIGSALQQAPGTAVHLPVSVKGLDGSTGGIPVTGIELHIDYDKTSITYDTTVNFSPLTPASQWFYGASDIEYGTNWLEPSGLPLNIPDNTILFDVVFDYLGGTTELIFDSVRCLLFDSAFNIISGVHYVNGMITPSQGSGESRWNGTGSWITAANWSNGIPGDSTDAVIESGEVTVLSNAVCNSMTINSGTTLNIAQNYYLTINHNYTNNGTFNLLSSTEGTGSLIVKGSVSGTGINNLNRFVDLTSGFPAFVSSPVVNSTAAVFSTNTIEKYSETTTSWIPLSSSEILETAKGYRLSGNSSETFQFQGSLRTSDVTVNDLTYTGAALESQRGLNLVGNPYPSAIKVEPGNWIRTNLDMAVYVWNDYKYVSWNGSIGALKDGIIPAMQGFFVKSNASGATLTIPASSRLHSLQPLYKNTEEVSDMISMKLQSKTDTTHFDEAFVHILNLSGEGFDSEYDAYKLFGNTSFPQLFTKTNNQLNLSINTIPQFSSVPVEYSAGSAGPFKIIFGNIESFQPSQPLFFEDKITNTVFNIRSLNEYSFTSPGTEEPNRFILHFQPVGIEDNHHTEFNSWCDDSHIHLSSLNGNNQVDQLDIFSITGRRIISISDLHLPAKIQRENLAPGIYILKLTMKDGLYTQKLLVK